MRSIVLAMLLTICFGGAVRADVGDPIVVELPGLASDAVVCASGRLLLLPMPRLEKIAVVDLQAGQIVRYLSVGSHSFQVVAGATKAVVEFEVKRIIQRYDLATGTAETSRTIRETGHLAMGWASEGPLLVGPELLDIKTLGSAGISILHRDASNSTTWKPGLGNFKPEYAVARSDGQVFAAGKALLVIKGKSAEIYQDEVLVWGSSPAPPNDEIDRLFPAAFECHGNFASQPTPRLQLGRTGDVFAALQPQYVVAVPFTVRAGAGISRLAVQHQGLSPIIYDISGDPAGNPRDLAELLELPLNVEVSHPANAFPLEKRIIVDVANNRLMTIPATCDRVFIRTIAPDKRSGQP